MITAEQLLLDACRDAEFRDKWIHPIGGEPHQNWLLQVYVPVPEDAKDRTPEGCLRAVLAAQPAPAEPEPASMDYGMWSEPPNEWREAVLDQLAAHCMDAPEDEPPASILRRIIGAAVEIALDPRVSDAAQPAPVTDEVLDSLGMHDAAVKLARRLGYTWVGGEWAAQPAPAEDFCYCDDDISLQMVSGGAALEGLYGRVTLKINGQYVDYVKAQPAPAEPVSREHAIALRDAELCGCEDMYFAARPQIDTLQARRIYAAGFKAGYEVRPPAQPLRAEPVALESVHLTRDINGMCTVRVNGRVAIQDNGDIIDHMATLEWFAQPAPVPLTDTETHAELWKLAVRKGLVTVRSELIDPRNHGTRVSWMQGHDKACDISNDAAAHGIAASPEVPK